MSEWLIQAIGFVGMALCISSYQCKDAKRLLLVQLTGNTFYVVQFILLGAYSGCALALLQVLSSLVLCLEREDRRVWIGWKWIFVAGVIGASLLTWKDIFSLFPCVGAIVFVLGNWTKNGKVIRLSKLLCVGPGWLIYNFYARTWAGVLAELFGIGSTLISIYRYGLNDLDKQD